MLKDILENVAAEMGLNVRDITRVCSFFDGEYLQLSFDCVLLHYECYIEPEGNIVGFNYYPVSVDGLYRAA